MKTVAKIGAWLLAAAVPLLANPILSHKYTADPQPLVWNDRLYVFASNDNYNPPIKDGGYDIFYYTLMSSDDMVNWVDHGEVFKVKRDMKWANQCYAPGAAVRNNKVYLYVPDGGASIGVVYAEKPEGPWTDPLGKTLISKSNSQNTNVPWLFDPAAFVDSDGQAYLYFGGGPENTEDLRAIKLNNDMISTSGNAVTINSPCSFEAAYVHKRNGTYYFSYSTNYDGQCSPKGGSAWIDYLTSSHPMNNFTYKGTLISNPTLNGNNINHWGNNHQGVVEYKGKWYAFYHDRRVKIANGIEHGELRSVSVDLLEYNTNGTIKQVTVTADGPPQIKNFNPYNTIKAATINKQSGIKTNDSISAAEGNIVVDISNNDWIRLKGVDFGTAGAEKVTVRAAGTGSIEFRIGSQTGTVVATVNISSAGLNTWKDFEADVSNLSGLKDYLYLVFKGTGTEAFRLSSYQFHEIGANDPDENGYFFHHTYEDGTTQGWSGRFGAGTVANTTAQKANGSMSLFMSNRTETYQGPAYNLNMRAFVPGKSYSFSVLAMYADGPESSPFKFTLQYDLDGETVYDQIDLAEAEKGKWVMLKNANFPIPVGATNLVLYVEMPESEDGDFYIDDAMGGIAGAKAPGIGEGTPILNVPSIATNGKSEIYNLKGNKVSGVLPSGVYIEKRRGMPSEVFVVK